MTVLSHLKGMPHLGETHHPGRALLMHLGQLIPALPPDIRRIFTDQHPDWPDFMHVDPSANPHGNGPFEGIAYENARTHGGEIVGVVGVTGVPNGVFHLDSLANWDPHDLLNVLGHVLGRLRQGNFGVDLHRVAWPREVHNPLAGDREHTHPLGLLLYHLAYAHEPDFRESVIARAEAKLRELLNQHETVIANGHSYGALILKDAIARLPDDMARRLILIALGHAYGELAHGLSPIGPKTSPQELLDMMHRVRGAMMMRVHGDGLSGIPLMDRTPDHCEIVQLPRTSPFELGLGGHCTVRTRPDAQQKIASFLERTLAA